MNGSTFERVKGVSVKDAFRLRGKDGAYFASADLLAAVNAAIALERPLLVTGEPGCGKTTLAYAIANELGLDKPLRYDVRSDSQGRDLLYRFDHLKRYWDVQNHDPGANDLDGFVRLGVLGEAFESKRQRVVLIDEIDKAGRDLPNDLLQALEEKWFEIREVQRPSTPDTAARPPREVRAAQSPVVVITSNRESQLPVAFLRRCVFHFIEMTPELLHQIVDDRFSDGEVSRDLAAAAIGKFEQIRRHKDELGKPPSTSELLDWVKLLAGIDNAVQLLAGRLAKLPHLGVLLKNEDDIGRVVKGQLDAEA